MADDPRGGQAAPDGFGEVEASSAQRAEAAAGDARELSALETLPADVLEAVLEELGPVEASRLRPVSRAMRHAVERVSEWRSLRLELYGQEQLERMAAWLASSAAGAFRIRLATGATLQLSADLQRHERPDLARFFPLLSACSALSGGLGSVSLRVRANANAYVDHSEEELVVAAVNAMGVTVEGGASSRCDTLKILELDLSRRQFSDEPEDRSILKLLSLLPRLERLSLGCDFDPKTTASLSTALPSLRSAALWFTSGAALAALASHPALEELTVTQRGIVNRGFEAFTAGPAARRLRTLTIRFADTADFHLTELPSLERLTSLETLDLNINCMTLFDACGPASELAGLLDVRPLASLGKLRELNLSLWWRFPAGAPHLCGLAGTIAALRARSLVALRLKLYAHGPDAMPSDAETDAALAGLLRAAGPALLELDVKEMVLRGEAARALASCPRLRRLSLFDASRASHKPAAPLAAAVEALAACPRLRELSGLALPFDSERGAAEVLEPLRRLAAACALGSGAGSLFVLRPGAGLGGAGRVRALELAKDRALSVFPTSKALIASR